MVVVGDIIAGLREPSMALNAGIDPEFDDFDSQYNAVLASIQEKGVVEVCPTSSFGGWADPRHHGPHSEPLESGVDYHNYVLECLARLREKKAAELLVAAEKVRRKKAARERRARRDNEMVEEVRLFHTETGPQLARVRYRWGDRHLIDNPDYWGSA